MFTTLSKTQAAREQRARRALRRQGYRLNKSQWRLGSIDNLGGYRIINTWTNFVDAGARWELSLDDVERWLAE